MTKRRLFFLLGWTVLVIFTCAGTYRIIRYHGDLATLDWPTCEGTITESRGLPCTRKGGHPGLIPHVRYAYRVDGVDYVGSRRTTDDRNRCGNSDVIREFLQNYPLEAKVTVSYDADDPSSSYLRAGPDAEATFLYIVSLMFVTLGVIGMALIALIPDWVASVLQETIGAPPAPVGIPGAAVK